jgi:hypothetical protein
MILPVKGVGRHASSRLSGNISICIKAPFHMNTGSQLAHIALPAVYSTSNNLLPDLPIGDRGGCPADLLCVPDNRQRRNRDTTLTVLRQL